MIEERTLTARWPHSISVVALSTLLLAGAPSFATGVKVALILAISACALDLARREARDPGDPFPIISSIAVLLVIAVIFPSRFSGDIWSYAIAGRMVTVHHASPYLHQAHSFPLDPFLAFVGKEWRNGTTPYGPLFTLFSSGVALVGGSHSILYRLAYQASAAVSIGLALLMLWRTNRSTSTLALLGLHPVITCWLVNGGHNDAFIGLGILLAVIDARRERFGRAGCWVAAAILVKATAGLALLPLMVWAWGRGRWRSVGRIAAAPLLVAVPTMLLTPGMMKSLDSAKTTVITRASLWNYPLRRMTGIFPESPHTTTRLVSYSLILVVALVVCVALIARRRADPGPGVVAAVSAWLVFSAYVLPWYTVWALPTAASRVRSRLTWLVAIQGAAIAAVSVIPRTSLESDHLVSDIVHFWLPGALAAMFVWAVIPALGRDREPAVAARRTL